MLIIFPTNDNNGVESIRSSHFGKANYYTLVKVLENGMYDVKSIKNEDSQNHSCGGAANKILSYNADAMVISGIGGRPAQIFKSKNLEIFIDKSSKTIKESLELFRRKKLASLDGQGTCKSHD